MKLTNIFSRLLAVFGFLLIFGVSGWGACGTSNGLWTPSSTATTGSVTTTAEYYTISVAAAGDLNISVQNTYSGGGTRTLTTTLYKENSSSCTTASEWSAPIVKNTTQSSGDIPVTAGTYTLKLVSSSSSNTGYSLTGSFTQPPVVTATTMSVNENSAGGTVVGTVSATNSPTSFTLTNTNGTAQSLFDISASGQITVHSGATLDYETTSSYTLKATATNGAGTSNPAATVTINLNNILPPTVNASSFTVPSGSGVGTIIGTVSTGGGPATNFSINDSTFAISNSGVITVASSGAMTPVGQVYTPTVTASSVEGSNSNQMTITVVQAPLVPTTGGRDFAQRTQYNLFGDVQVIGNTVLCILNSSGACIEPTNSNSNDATDLEKAPQSSSTLTIPTGATIQYARLYWQGRKAATSSNTAWDTTSIASAKTIEMRKGTTGTYTSLTADFIDLDSTSSNNWVRIYSAGADVSSIVDGSGIYSINPSSFYTETGATNSKNPSDGLGTYGAWILVVVYADPNETKARNITVFDGYKQITSSTGDINVAVSGFLTPKSGTVDSKTYLFAGEGDKYITGDHLKMAGATYNTTLVDLAGSNAFNSRIDVPAVRNPSLSNNNGIDIQKYDTGTTSGALGIIGTKETGANFQFTSTQDTYFPSVIVFSTQLYLPQLCYDYSIKQDGQYLPVNRSTYPLAQLDSLISSSNIDITVYVRNNEADLAAQGIAIKSDINDSVFTQSGDIYTSNVNGSALLDRGAPTLSTPLCTYDKNGDNSVSNNGCTNGHDIRKGNGSLDAHDYVFTKYTLTPTGINGIVDVNQSLGLSLKYYIVANGNKIEYPDYALGGPNVPLCPQSTSYQPTFGSFNVVQRGLKTNNLFTQVSRKPFNVDVIFDSSVTTGDNQAPTSDINTTVLVEMMDIDSFGDINASCANPDSRLTAPIAVPITFSPSNYQTSVPTQTSDYYNFAVKNGAFRVWYFTENNNTLIQNWTAATSDNGKTITSISSNLYTSTRFPACISSCTSATSATCFQCIKDNYAKPLCSRDNFSVRPESYDVRLYDVNNSLPVYNINTDPGNLKNTTKIDITYKDHYTPDYTTPNSRLQLAGGYNYRYDIAATGHDSLLLVPGYTRYFNGSLDYSASLIWSPVTPKTGCNDTTDKNLIFYVANGVMANKEDKNSQVGEYILAIQDNTWTAVDSQNLSHHITGTGGFLSGIDCIANSSITTNVNGQNGCIINTNHGSDGGGRTYKDYNVSFYPYDFNVSNIVVSKGVNFSPLIKDTNNSFVYMSDINVTADENMSVHIAGTIRPEGYDHTLLSNFVDNCYAQPIDLNVSRTNYSNLTLVYRSKYQDFNSTNVLKSNILNDLNNTTNPISLATSHFYKDMSGGLNTILHLNFDRNVSKPENPETITFHNYIVQCQSPSANCAFDANLTRMATTGNLASAYSATNNDLNITVQHYSGRTHAPRYRFTSADGNASIYYEVYCDANGTKNLLPGYPLIMGDSDSVGWYLNRDHNTLSDGNIVSVIEKNLTNNVELNTTASPLPLSSLNGTSRATLHYKNLKGFPYKTTMQDTPSGWLIYNPYDSSATANEFEVEFYNSAVNWTGVKGTNTTTDSDAKPTTSKRILW